MSSESLTIVEPLLLFITIGEGVGKSYLVKSLIIFWLIYLIYIQELQKKRNVLLLGPTGIGEFYIDETAIHAGLGINPNCNSYTFG